MLRQVPLKREEDDEVLRRLREIAPTKRILAAEDNVINQKVLIGTLHAFGFQEIDVASDGAQAVSMATESPGKYDLVLMDISMPLMDGHEATARIRDSRLTVPIVAMTAYALKGDMERCLEKGMDDYIAKPINRKLLVEKLVKWLAPRTGPHAELVNSTPKTTADTERAMPVPVDATY